MVGTTMAGQRLLEGAHKTCARLCSTEARSDHSFASLPHSPNCPSDHFLLWCTIYCEIPGALVPVIAKFEFAIHEHVSFTV